MKFALTPTQSGYGTQFNGAKAVMLEGAANFYVPEVKRNVRTVSVSWSLNELGYQYARSFFRGITQKGALPFTIDLVLDNNELQEYTAKFVQGTWQLSAASSGKYVVQATLEVKQLPYDPLNVNRFLVYSALGENADIDLDLFNQIVNVNWPHV